MSELDEVTQSILSAWDEEEQEPSDSVAEPDQSEPEEPTPDETETGEEPAEEPEAPEDEPAEEEELEPGVGFDTDDVEIRAFLNKYDGDAQKALRGAAELARLMGRRDEEKDELLRRNAELERRMFEAQALSGMALPLNEEQQAWVEGAAMSPNPSMYVRQAVDEGAFDMARAVCREWARENPFEATRAGQFVDVVEAQAAQQAEAPLTASTDQILEALANQMPDLRSWVPQITSVVQNLGTNHPLVSEARSNDPDTAFRGIIGLYEIARASTASVQRQRDEIRQEQRASADGARAKAAVSSATNSPKTLETPRLAPIMPGLTEADLDTEFAQS